MKKNKIIKKFLITFMLLINIMPLNISKAIALKPTVHITEFCHGNYKKYTGESFKLIREMPYYVAPGQEFYYSTTVEETITSSFSFNVLSLNLGIEKSKSVSGTVGNHLHNTSNIPKSVKLYGVYNNYDVYIEDRIPNSNSCTYRVVSGYEPKAFMFSIDEF